MFQLRRDDIDFPTNNIVILSKVVMSRSRLRNLNNSKIKLIRLTIKKYGNF